MSFASATVLQQEFGWKVGIPAYAVASYVAASRVQMKRHYLSDVTFGAALGVIAGRSVSIGHGRRLMVTPMATPSGTAAGFTIVRKRQRSKPRAAIRSIQQMAVWNGLRAWVAALVVALPVAAWAADTGTISGT